MINLKLIVVLILVFFPLMAGAQSFDEGEHLYNGLAEIIEKNMDSPQNCAQEVETFLDQNEAIIAKTLADSQKIKPKIESDIQKALPGDPAAAGEFAMKYKNMQAQQTPGMLHYQQALKEFSYKNPTYIMPLSNVITKKLFGESIEDTMSKYKDMIGK